jgi:zinc transport system substrate-binding protein
MRIVLILALLVAGVGCAGGYGRDVNGLSVVAGFYPLAWAAEEVGRERVDVVNLTPQGAEPHDLELSARDVERVRDANLVLLLRGFQPALDRAAEQAGGVRVVDLLEHASPVPGEEGKADPHVWLDPVRFAGVVREIGDALALPAAGEKLATRVEALDGEFRRGLARCERREIVTSHAAFGYLAARYRLEQIPITGVSPEAEPSARDLERVADTVRRRGATTVFFETLVSPRLAQTVAREAGARTAVLDPIEGLTEEKAERGGDYFSVMRANLRALRRALGCR